MELLSEIRTGTGKKLQLIQGDLTNIPNEHKLDILVVSAFPNDYIPTPTSLIGALNKKGVSVEQLSRDKEIDIRKYSYCWLSKEIRYPNIKRILCFEPTERDNPYSLIACIFQSIMLVAKTHSVKQIAMPLVMTGDQKYSDHLVTNELIETSLFWLDNLPCDTIKIVERSADKLILLKSAFDKNVRSNRTGPEQNNYDFFISYSRQNAEEANLIKDKLKSSFNIFIDTQSIDIGSNWLHTINNSLEKSKRFIVCLSADYVNSKMCKYEYAFCNLKYINEGADTVLPLYLYTTKLPFEMSILNYFNAREGDKERISQFCDLLIKKYTNE